MNQAMFLLNTLQQEFGNQEPGEAADDYKTRNTGSAAGELLLVMCNHAR